MKKENDSELLISMDEIKARNSDSLFRTAVNFVNEGDSKSVRTAYLMFLEIIERDPNYKNIDGDNPYFHLGCIASVYMRDPKLAIEGYTKAIEMNPGDFGSLQFRGHCFMELNKYNEALSDFEKAFNLVKGDDFTLPGIREDVQKAKNILAETTA
jgi:tetratricopeptide (TPR) repeat protein